MIDGQYDTVWFINNPAYKFLQPGDGDTARCRRRSFREPIPEPRALRELEFQDLLFYIDLALLVALKPRERKIVNLYFGLDGGETMTLEQIGELWAISPERVRQLKNRGLQRLYRSGAGRILKELWGECDSSSFSETRPRRRPRRRLRLEEYRPYG